MLNTKSSNKILQKWFLDLVRTWRCKRTKVAEAIRNRVADSLSDLSPPVQAWIFVRQGTSVPVEATFLVLRRDQKRPDGETQVVFVDDEGRMKGDAPGITCFLEELKMFWLNMRANLTADRSEEFFLKPWHIGKESIDLEVPMTLWKVPGSLARVEITELVEHIFREEPKITPSLLPKKVPKHIYRMGMKREFVGLPRWLELRAPDLMRIMGLPGGWWCGLFLSRRDIFGSAIDGDVDILAGPLDFTLSHKDWEKRIEQESRNLPLTTVQSNIISLTGLRAAEEGMILWPPSMEMLVACEVKVSWFHPEDQKWKRTHKGEAREVKGQLSRLMNEGVNRVAFLHLGATKPRIHSLANPYFQAAIDGAAGDDDFPLVFNPTEMPECGYFTAMLGAVPNAEEDQSGAGGVPRVLHPCLPNKVLKQGWRELLQDRLARFPRPKSPWIFIFSCTKCGRWDLRDNPLDMSCTCPRK